MCTEVGRCPSAPQCKLHEIDRWGQGWQPAVPCPPEPSPFLPKSLEIFRVGAQIRRAQFYEADQSRPERQIVSGEPVRRVRKVGLQRLAHDLGFTLLSQRGPSPQAALKARLDAHGQSSGRHGSWKLLTTSIARY